MNVVLIDYFLSHIWNTKQCILFTKSGQFMNIFSAKHLLGDMTNSLL